MTVFEGVREALYELRKYVLQGIICARDANERLQGILMVWYAYLNECVMRESIHKLHECIADEVREIQSYIDDLQ